MAVLGRLCDFCGGKLKNGHDDELLYADFKSKVSNSCTRWAVKGSEKVSHMCLVKFWDGCKWCSM